MHQLLVCANTRCEAKGNEIRNIRFFFIVKYRRICDTLLLRFNYRRKKEFDVKKLRIECLRDNLCEASQIRPGFCSRLVIPKRVRPGAGSDISGEAKTLKKESRASGLNGITEQRRKRVH